MRLNRAGFSLVEMMIALGVLSIVGVGTMSFFGRSMNLSRHVEQKTKIRTHLDEMALYWSNSENCKKDLIDSGVLNSINLSSSTLAINRSLQSLKYEQRDLKSGEPSLNDGGLILKSINVGAFRDISPEQKAQTVYSTKFIFSFSKSDGFAFHDVDLPIVFETSRVGAGLKLVGCSSAQKYQYSLGDVAHICESMGTDYQFDGKHCQNTRITNLENQVTNLSRTIANLEGAINSNTYNAGNTEATLGDKLDSPSCWGGKCIVSVRFVNKKPGAKVIAHSTKCVTKYGPDSCTKNELIGYVGSDGSFQHTGSWNCEEMGGEGTGADQTWYIEGATVGSHSWRCKG